MKKFKLPLAIIAVIIAITGAFAFKSQQVPAKKHMAETYFKLVENGDPLVRTDWVLADAGSCPTTHSDVVCRIITEPDGDNPDAGDFADILSITSDFSQAYPAKVSYEYEP
jgi:hypothetical protein